MTDFHCQRCRKHVTIYMGARRVWCACGTRMRLGRGRRTHYDPWASLQLEGVDYYARQLTLTTSTRRRS